MEFKTPTNTYTREVIMEYTTDGTDHWGLTRKEELVRCKDCSHQEKYWHADLRRKAGGSYVFGCDLADGYSHVCLDDDFCSRAERKPNNER